jgi:hypothetical protein
MHVCCVVWFSLDAQCWRCPVLLVGKRPCTVEPTGMHILTTPAACCSVEVSCCMTAFSTSLSAVRVHVDYTVPCHSILVASAAQWSQLAGTSCQCGVCSTCCSVDSCLSSHCWIATVTARSREATITLQESIDFLSKPHALCWTALTLMVLPVFGKQCIAV